MVPITIKPIDNSYSKCAIDLILKIQKEEFNTSITIEDQPDLFEIENYYLKKGGNFWGAFVNDELVGTIALAKFENNSGAVRKMFVKEQFRGKELGIAQCLLNELISYSILNDITNLYLGTITVFKAAQRFYERNNFTRIDKKELPSLFPLMNADNVFYHLNIQ